MEKLDEIINRILELAKDKKEITPEVLAKLERCLVEFLGNVEEIWKN